MKEKLMQILEEGVTMDESHVDQLVEAFSDELTKERIAIHADLVEKHQQELEAVSAITDAKLDEAVDVAVQTVLTENQERLEKADRVEQIEEAFADVRKAMAKLDMALNESVADTVLTEEIETWKNDFAHLTDINADLHEALREANEELELAKRSIIFEHHTRPLVDTDRERVGQILETINFESTDEFLRGLKLIIEQVSDRDDDEDENEDEDEDEDSKDKKESNADLKESVAWNKLSSEERAERFRAMN